MTPERRLEKLRDLKRNLTYLFLDFKELKEDEDVLIFLQKASYQLLLAEQKLKEIELEKEK
jgi:hypothetical protein